MLQIMDDFKVYVEDPHAAMGLSCLPALEKNNA